MICGNKYCWRCMRWKKKNNKPANFTARDGDGTFIKIKSIKISGNILASGGPGGSNNGFKN